MNKFLMAGLLAASLSSALMASEMSGYVSDAHCGAKHDKVSAANTKCVVDMCVKGGADPVLVSDGKVMKFDADSMAKVKPFAGQMVKIDGSMDGDMVKVTSIEKAQ